MPVLLWINPQEAVNKWYETEKDDITNVMFKDTVSFVESRMGLNYECKVDYEMKSAPRLKIHKNGSVIVKLEYRLPLNIRGKSQFNPVSINLSLHSIIYIELKSIDKEIKNDKDYDTKIYIHLTQTVPFWQTIVAEKAKIQAKQRINKMISLKLPLQLKYFKTIVADLDNSAKESNLFGKNERTSMIFDAMTISNSHNTNKNNKNSKNSKNNTNQKSKNKDAHWVCVARYYTKSEIKRQRKKEKEKKQKEKQKVETAKQENRTKDNIKIGKISNEKPKIDKESHKVDHKNSKTIDNNNNNNNHADEYKINENIFDNYYSVDKNMKQYKNENEKEMEKVNKKDQKKTEKIVKIVKIEQIDIGKQYKTGEQKGSGHHKTQNGSEPHRIEDEGDDDAMDAIPLLSDNLGCYQLLATRNCIEDMIKTKFINEYKSEIETEFTNELKKRQVYIDPTAKPVARLKYCSWNKKLKEMKVILTLGCRVYSGGYKTILNKVVLSVQPSITHIGLFESYLTMNLNTYKLNVESDINMTNDAIIFRALIPVLGWIEAGVETVLISNKCCEMKEAIKNKCIEKLEKFQIEIPEKMRNYMAPVKIQIENDAVYIG